MIRKTSRKRSSRRRTSLRRNPPFSPTELRNIERANLRLAAALAHIAPGVDKSRLPKITMIAQSQAHKAATREGEMYGGPLNSTTYPRKHYALLEELMGGHLTAKELRYFNDAYDAYAQWNYETSSPELRERWADLRQRRHEKRVPLRKNSRSEYRGFEIEKVTRAIQMGHDQARIAGTKRPGTRILPVQYLIHYPDGGAKSVSTMKAARDYIDEYMGDA